MESFDGELDAVTGAELTAADGSEAAADAAASTLTAGAELAAAELSTEAALDAALAELPELIAADTAALNSALAELAELPLLSALAKLAELALLSPLAELPDLLAAQLPLLAAHAAQIRCIDAWNNRHGTGIQVRVLRRNGSRDIRHGRTIGVAAARETDVADDRTAEAAGAVQVSVEATPKRKLGAANAGNGDHAKSGQDAQRKRFSEAHHCLTLSC